MKDIIVLTICGLLVYYCFILSLKLSAKHYLLSHKSVRSNLMLGYWGLWSLFTGASALFLFITALKDIFNYLNIWLGVLSIQKL